MANPIHAAFFKPPFQGGVNFAGRLAIRASACVKSPFLSRPKKWGKKGDLNPHGYWLHAALTNTTSLRTFRLLGRHASGRKRIKKSVTNKTYVGRVHAATSDSSGSRA